jgi:hypothetical protein
MPGRQRAGRGQRGVEDGDVEWAGRQRLAWIGAEGADTRQQREGLLEKDVAGRHQQGAPRAAGRDGSPGLVVQRERAAAVQAGLDQARAGRQRDDAAGLAASRHAQVLCVVQLAVDRERHDRLGVRVAGVADRDEQLERARGGPGGQRGDRQVLAAGAHAHEAHLARQGRQAGRQTAVADDHRRWVLGAARLGDREREGRAPVGRTGGRLGAGQGRAEYALVAAARGQHARLRPGGDQGHAVLHAQPVDQRLDGRAGPRETRGLDIAGGHRCGAVEQDDQIALGDHLAAHPGPGEREHERDHDQQLQEEQQVALEALPRRVGRAVAHDQLPEQGARDRHLAAAQPQHVQDDDGRGQRGESQQGGGEQAHQCYRVRRRARPCAYRAGRALRRASRSERSGSGRRGRARTRRFRPARRPGAGDTDRAARRPW